MKNFKFTFIFIIILLATLNLNAQTWEGKWVRKGGCDLDITNSSTTSFKFSFNCFNGTNYGELEATAIIKGNKAKFDGLINGETYCPILFTLNENSITVEEDRSKQCENGAGNGVYFNGKYERKKQSKSKNIKVKK